MSAFTRKLKEYRDNLRGRKRVGPVSRPHRDLVLAMAGARNAVLAERDRDVRDFLSFVFSKTGISRSQIFQDVFILYVLGEKTGGFFCEFGATDGVSLSNSYTLEMHYGWTGICAEPARSWHADLRANRPGARIETDCVWSRTGEKLTFRESEARELSTISDFAEVDRHRHSRRSATTYDVRTISLDDMLEKHGAPTGFDYLSIDTEGSEYDILSAFDIERFRP